MSAATLRSPARRGIDLDHEQPITLAEAIKLPLLKRNGRAPHIATIHRWVSVGINGVRLEVVQLGGTRCTTREAVIRFIERLTANDHGGGAAPTPSERRRSIAAAGRELAVAGI